MNIGTRIKQARLANNTKMSQQQLATAVGVTRQAVALWEAGETKSLRGENLMRVALALGVKTTWLCHGTEVPANEQVPLPNSVRTMDVSQRAINIGMRIKQARLAYKPKKMTQQQLADIVGVSQPAVAQWEAGVSGTLDGTNLVDVAQTLGVTPTWLFYGTSSPDVNDSQTVQAPLARVVAHSSVMEVSDETLKLALSMESLPKNHRDTLQAFVDSFVQQMSGKSTSSTELLHASA